MWRLTVVGTMAVWAVACGAGVPRAACEPHPAPGVVGSVCGFSNPEDVEAIAPAALLLVSQMRPLTGEGQGSIAAVTFESLASPQPEPWRIWPPSVAALAVPASAPVGDPSCTEPPDAVAFAPHGLTSRTLTSAGITRVAVMSHAPREAVELFDLQGSGHAARLVWRGCVPLPPSNAGNDLALTADGALVVANCMPTFGGLSTLVSMLSANLGIATGDVMIWSADGGWRHLPNSEARMANGIAVTPEAREVFFTETGARRVGRIDGLGPRTVPAVMRLAIDGAPDNLSWTSRGTLVTATHIASRSFVSCVFGRRPCRSAWELVEIDPRTLASTVLVRDDDGDAIGAVSSAAEVDGRFYLGAVFDDRIGVWSPAR